MEDVFYYRSTSSGRTTFVKVEGVGGKQWTNEATPVKVTSIPDLKPFSLLKGKQVQLNGHLGVISACLPVCKPICGRYVGENKYLSHKQLLNMNNLVMVHWKTGVNTCWQRFDDLTLI